MTEPFSSPLPLKPANDNKADHDQHIIEVLAELFGRYRMWHSARTQTKCPRLLVKQHDAMHRIRRLVREIWEAMRREGVPPR